MPKINEFKINIILSPQTVTRMSSRATSRTNMVWLLAYPPSTAGPRGAAPYWPHRLLKVFLKPIHSRPDDPRQGVPFVSCLLVQWIHQHSFCLVFPLIPDLTSIKPNPNPRERTCIQLQALIGACRPGKGNEAAAWHPKHNSSKGTVQMQI